MARVDSLLPMAGDPYLYEVVYRCLLRLVHSVYERSVPIDELDVVPTGDSCGHGLWPAAMASSLQSPACSLWPAAYGLQS